VKPGFIGYPIKRAKVIKIAATFQPETVFSMILNKWSWQFHQTFP
jgi:hypothetical protein